MTTRKVVHCETTPGLAKACPPTGPVRPPRAGISILEVIACTMIVAVMMVPIAGVMRSSSQAIARAQGDGSIESQGRRSLRWLADQIRMNPHTQVVSGGRALRITTLAGRTALVRISRSQLVMDDGIATTVLAESASAFRATELKSTATGNPVVGLELQLDIRDPATRVTKSAAMTVAF
ncbi:hypothetical protein [Crateriforma conspicua]|uniref:hypothetical protein n=1 Tax=Crateriforma conspicua TaxID=2527996 RepID=UPI00118B98DB|nr:hypothetical protein [Crateriforma conspicua]QDV61778.1 hypothetical protein Mal65_09050 [Crateriforma conspicua]